MPVYQLVEDFRKVHSSMPDFYINYLVMNITLQLYSHNYLFEIMEKRIVVNSDDRFACQLITSGKFKCKNLQNCLRENCFLAASNDFQIRAVF